MHSQRTPKEAIELFHLLFLREMPRVLPPASYAVKGGVNLRLMLGSPRASEDLDIDIQQVAKHTLEKNVERTLKGDLNGLLARYGVTVTEFSSPKQTATVQRWKVALQAAGQEIPTKIEFSRRGFVGEPTIDLTSPEICSRFGIPAFPVAHYTSTDAVAQKLHALASRSISQARDVFDLAFLLSLQGSTMKPNEETREQIRANISAITFADYQSQVVPYLALEVAQEKGSFEAWDHMKRQVEGLLSGQLADTGGALPPPPLPDHVHDGTKGGGYGGG